MDQFSNQRGFYERSSNFIPPHSYNAEAKVGVPTAPAPAPASSSASAMLQEAAHHHQALTAEHYRSIAASAGQWPIDPTEYLHRYSMATQPPASKVKPVSTQASLSKNYQQQLSAAYSTHHGFSSTSQMPPHTRPPDTKREVQRGIDSYAIQHPRNILPPQPGNSSKYPPATSLAHAASYQNLIPEGYYKDGRHSLPSQHSVAEQMARVPSHPSHQHAANSIQKKSHDPSQQRSQQGPYVISNFNLKPGMVKKAQAGEPFYAANNSNVNGKSLEDSCTFIRKVENPWAKLQGNQVEQASIKKEQPTHSTAYSNKHPMSNPAEKQYCDTTKVNGSVDYYGSYTNPPGHTKPPKPETVPSTSGAKDDFVLDLSVKTVRQNADSTAPDYDRMASVGHGSYEKTGYIHAPSPSSIRVSSSLHASSTPDLISQTGYDMGVRNDGYPPGSVQQPSRHLGISKSLKRPCESPGGQGSKSARQSISPARSRSGLSPFDYGTGPSTSYVDPYAGKNPWKLTGYPPSSSLGGLPASAPSSIYDPRVKEAQGHKMYKEQVRYPPDERFHPSEAHRSAAEKPRDKKSEAATFELYKPWSSGLEKPQPRDFSPGLSNAPTVCSASNYSSHPYQMNYGVPISTPHLNQLTSLAEAARRTSWASHDSQAASYRPSSSGPGQEGHMSHLSHHQSINNVLGSRKPSVEITPVINKTPNTNSKSVLDARHYAPTLSTSVSITSHSGVPITAPEPINTKDPKLKFDNASYSYVPKLQAAKELSTLNSLDACKTSISEAEVQIITRENTLVSSAYARCEGSKAETNPTPTLTTKPITCNNDNNSNKNEQEKSNKDIPSNLDLKDNISIIKDKAKDKDNNDKKEDINISDMEIKNSDTKPSDIKTADVKSSDIKTDDVKSAEIKPSDIKPADGKPDEVKPVAINPTDIKPVDIKPSDVKPPDVKSGEVKPTDIQPVDIKPSDVNTSKETDAATVNNTSSAKEEVLVNSNEAPSKFNKNDDKQDKDKSNSDVPRLKEDEINQKEDKQGECVTKEVPAVSISAVTEKEAKEKENAEGKSTTNADTKQTNDSADTKSDSQPVSDPNPVKSKPNEHSGSESTTEPLLASKGSEEPIRTQKSPLPGPVKTPVFGDEEFSNYKHKLYKMVGDSSNKITPPVETEVQIVTENPPVKSETPKESSAVIEIKEISKPAEVTQPEHKNTNMPIDLQSKSENSVDIIPIERPKEINSNITNNKPEDPTAPKIHHEPRIKLVDERMLKPQVAEDCSRKSTPDPGAYPPTSKYPVQHSLIKPDSNNTPHLTHLEPRSSASANAYEMAYKKPNPYMSPRSDGLKSPEGYPPMYKIDQHSKSYKTPYPEKAHQYLNYDPNKSIQKASPSVPYSHYYEKSDMKAYENKVFSNDPLGAIPSKNYSDYTTPPKVPTSSPSMHHSSPYSQAIKTERQAYDMANYAYSRKTPDAKHMQGYPPEHLAKHGYMPIKRENVPASTKASIYSQNPSAIPPKGYEDPRAAMMAKHSPYHNEDLSIHKDYGVAHKKPIQPVYNSPKTPKDMPVPYADPRATLYPSSASKAYQEPHRQYEHTIQRQARDIKHEPEQFKPPPQYGRMTTHSEGKPPAEYRPLSFSVAKSPEMGGHVFSSPSSHPVTVPSCIAQHHAPHHGYPGAYQYSQSPHNIPHGTVVLPAKTSPRQSPHSAYSPRLIKSPGAASIPSPVSSGSSHSARQSPAGELPVPGSPYSWRLPLQSHPSKSPIPVQSAHATHDSIRNRSPLTSPNISRLNQSPISIHSPSPSNIPHTYATSPYAGYPGYPAAAYSSPHSSNQGTPPHARPPHSSMASPQLPSHSNVTKYPAKPVYQDPMKSPHLKPAPNPTMQQGPRLPHPGNSLPRHPQSPRHIPTHPHHAPGYPQPQQSPVYHSAPPKASHHPRVPQQDVKDLTVLSSTQYPVTWPSQRHDPARLTAVSSQSHHPTDQARSIQSHPYHDQKYQPHHDPKHPQHDPKYPPHEQQRYPPHHDPKYSPHDPKYSAHHPKYPPHDPKYPPHELKYSPHDPKLPPHEQQRYPPHDPKYLPNNPQYQPRPQHDPKYPPHEAKYPPHYQQRYPPHDPKYPPHDPKYPPPHEQQRYPHHDPKYLQHDPKYPPHLYKHEQDVKMVDINRFKSPPVSATVTPVVPTSHPITVGENATSRTSSDLRGFRNSDYTSPKSYGTTPIHSNARPQPNPVRQEGQYTPEISNASQDVKPVITDLIADPTKKSGYKDYRAYPTTSGPLLDKTNTPSFDPKSPQYLAANKITQMSNTANLQKPNTIQLGNNLYGDMAGKQAYAGKSDTGRDPRGHFVLEDKDPQRLQTKGAQKSFETPPKVDIVENKKNTTPESNDSKEDIKPIIEKVTESMKSKETSSKSDVKPSIPEPTSAIEDLETLHRDETGFGKEPIDLFDNFENLIDDLSTHKDSMTSKKSKTLDRRYQEKLNYQKALDNNEIPIPPQPVIEEDDSEPEPPVKFRGKFRSIKDKAVERILYIYTSHSEESAAEMIPDDDASDFEETLERKIKSKAKKKGKNLKNKQPAKKMIYKKVPGAPAPKPTPIQSRVQLKDDSDFTLTSDESESSATIPSDDSDSSDSDSDVGPQLARREIDSGDDYEATVKSKKKSAWQSDSGDSDDYVPRRTRTRRARKRSSDEESYKPSKEKRSRRPKKSMKSDDSDDYEPKSAKRKSGDMKKGKNVKKTKASKEDSDEDFDDGPSTRGRNNQFKNKLTSRMLSPSSGSDTEVETNRKRKLQSPRSRLAKRRNLVDSDTELSDAEPKREIPCLDYEVPLDDSVVKKLLEQRGEELKREDVLEMKNWRNEVSNEMEKLLMKLDSDISHHKWKKPQFGRADDFYQGWQQELKKFKEESGRVPPQLLSSISKLESPILKDKPKKGTGSSSRNTSSPAKNTRSQSGIIKTSMALPSSDKDKVPKRDLQNSIIQKFFEKVVSSDDDDTTGELSRKFTSGPFSIYGPPRTRTGLTPTPSVAPSMMASDDSDRDSLASLRTDLPASDSVPVARRSSIANSLIRKLRRKYNDKRLNTLWYNRPRSILDSSTTPRLIPTPTLGSDRSPDPIVTRENLIKLATFFRTDGHVDNADWQKCLEVNREALKAVFGDIPKNQSLTNFVLSYKYKKYPPKKDASLADRMDSAASPDGSVSRPSTPADSLATREDDDDSEMRSERSESTFGYASNPAAIRKSSKRKIRKFRSGFDYIRKKKKSVKTEVVDEATPQSKKRVPVRKHYLWPENNKEVTNEVRNWIINKGHGETILHKAARLQYHDVVVYCAESPEFDINVRDNAGYTPLHEACNRGHLDIAQILCSHHAFVNAPGFGGSRPLHEAVENGHYEMARLLLSYGADPTLTTYAGSTSVDLALDKPTRELLEGYIADLKGKAADRWMFRGTAGFLDMEEKTQRCHIFKDQPLSPHRPEADKTDLDNSGSKSDLFPTTQALMADCHDDQMDFAGFAEADNIDLGFTFEITEAGTLPPLYQVEGRGPDNYVMMDDLLNHLGKSQEQLILAAEKVETLILGQEEFKRKARCSVLGQVQEWVLDGAMNVTMVKYTSNIVKLLDVEMVTVR